MRSTVPEIRIRSANEAPIRGGGDYVLYWMIAARRTRYNFALQRACDWAEELGIGLVILEPLRSSYPWASDRIHAFVIQGMADNSRALANRRVRYLPTSSRR